MPPSEGPICENAECGKPVRDVPGYPEYTDTGIICAACAASASIRETARLGKAETLRDRFAMAALPGVLAAYLHGEPGDMARRCNLAYEIADTMLEARKR